MNKEQKILFNLISKPTLSLNANQIDARIADEEEIDDIFNYDTLQAVLEYIENLGDAPERITEIDKKLVDCLDGNLALAIAESLEMI